MALFFKRYMLTIGVIDLSPLSASVCEVQQERALIILL